MEPVTWSVIGTRGDHIDVLYRQGQYQFITKAVVLDETIPFEELVAKNNPFLAEPNMDIDASSYVGREGTVS